MKKTLPHHVLPALLMSMLMAAGCTSIAPPSRKAQAPLSAEEQEQALKKASEAAVPTGQSGRKGG